VGWQHNIRTKTFLNFALHVEDFRVPAEWHFFATSHGNSTCDALGGTLKETGIKDKELAATLH
jgi:hypothetical protein